MTGEKKKAGICVFCRCQQANRCYVHFHKIIIAFLACKVKKNGGFYLPFAT